MEKTIEQLLRDGIAVKEKMLTQCVPGIRRLAEACLDSIARGGTIYLFGNGGSASDAQHIEAELMGRFEAKRGALPARALTANTSAITAVANDFGYEEVFARQLEIVDDRDVAVGLTTSGNSKNVVRGVEAAHKRGAFTVALTGETGGEIAGRVQLCVRVPSANTARIQEGHIAIGHILCRLIDDRLQTKP